MNGAAKGQIMTDASKTVAPTNGTTARGMRMVDVGVVLLRCAGVLLALCAGAVVVFGMIVCFDGHQTNMRGAGGRYELGDLFVQGGLSLAAIGLATLVPFVALVGWWRLPWPIHLLTLGLFCGGIGGIVELFL